MLNRLQRFLKTELFRYILTGGGAVFIDFIVYWGLSKYTHTDASWAKRIGFIAGGIWSFFANKFFTFKRPDFTIDEPLLFIVIYFSGFILNSVFHDWILVRSASNILAFIVATFISVIWNYAGQKWVVFKVKKY